MPQRFNLWYQATHFLGFVCKVAVYIVNIDNLCYSLSLPFSYPCFVEKSYLYTQNTSIYVFFSLLFGEFSNICVFLSSSWLLLLLFYQKYVKALKFSVLYSILTHLVRSLVFLKKSRYSLKSLFQSWMVGFYDVAHALLGLFHMFSTHIINKR